MRSCPLPPCLVALLLVLAVACERPRDLEQVQAVDLLARFGNAEHRPSGAPFGMMEHTFGGRSRASLIVPAESRITWKLLVPHRATFSLFTGVPDENGPASVAVRIGVSDGRIYVTLVEQTVTSAETAEKGWIPVRADLSPFAGRKLSLFYRPDRIRWELILGTHVLSGAPGVVYLAAPEIQTDRDGAREYFERRKQRPD